MTYIRILTIIVLLTIFGCNQTSNVENKVRGHSKLRILKLNDGVGDIFGPRLGFEFLTKDSAFHHSLAVVSLTSDSIGFVLIKQNSLNLLEYSGYAIKTLTNPDTFDDFISQGENHILHFKISKDRQNAELIYLDKGGREIDRVTPNEIVERYENAR